MAPQDLQLLVDSNGVIEGAPTGQRLMGRPVWEIVAPEDHDTVRQILERGRGECSVHLIRAGWPPQVRLRVDLFDAATAENGYFLLHFHAPEERAALALEEMVSVVAHEVKNPLAGIGGALEVVGARAADGSTEAKILLEAHRRVRTLDETLEDLLLLTRPLVVERTRVAFDRLLHEVARTDVADSADRLTIETESTSDPHLDVDANLTRRALVYILGHALQVGHGAVMVSLAACLGGMVIRVRYQGGSLERDIGDRIFDARYLKRSRPSGLRLPVAARLIRHHGGTIDVRIEGDRMNITVYFPAPE